MRTDCLVRPACIFIQALCISCLRALDHVSRYQSPCSQLSPGSLSLLALSLSRLSLSPGSLSPMHHPIWLSSEHLTSMRSSFIFEHIVCAEECLYTRTRPGPCPPRSPPLPHSYHRSTGQQAPVRSFSIKSMQNPQTSNKNLLLALYQRQVQFPCVSPPCLQPT